MRILTFPILLTLVAAACFAAPPSPECRSQAARLTSLVARFKSDSHVESYLRLIKYMADKGFLDSNALTKISSESKVQDPTIFASPLMASHDELAIQSVFSKIRESNEFTAKNMKEISERVREMTGESVKRQERRDRAVRETAKIINVHVKDTIRLPGRTSLGLLEPLEMPGGDRLYLLTGWDKDLFLVDPVTKMTTSLGMKAERLSVLKTKSGKVFFGTENLDEFEFYEVNPDKSVSLYRKFNWREFGFPVPPTILLGDFFFENDRGGLFFVCRLRKFDETEKYGIVDLEHLTSRIIVPPEEIFNTTIGSISGRVFGLTRNGRNLTVHDLTADTKTTLKGLATMTQEPSYDESAAGFSMVSSLYGNKWMVLDSRKYFETPYDEDLQGSALIAEKGGNYYFIGSPGRSIGVALYDPRKKEFEKLSKGSEIGFDRGQIIKVDDKLTLAVFFAERANDQEITVVSLPSKEILTFKLKPREKGTFRGFQKTADGGVEALILADDTLKSIQIYGSMK